MNRRISTKHWLTPTKVTNSYLTHMEILSHLKDIEMIRIKTMNPLLDQTEGLREEELEKNKSSPVHKKGKRPPRQLESQLKGPNLITKACQLPDWFQKPAKPPTPDRDWNKTLPDAHGPVQPSAKLFGLDGRQVIPFNHFINNDLTYLSGGVSSRTYTTSVINTKAADYSHIKWIKDLVPNKMWSQVSVSYDEHALWGISHWGRKQQQFYGFAANRESSRDVYSKRIIITVTKLQIVEWHNYKHLDWITVRRDDDKLSIIIQRRVEDLQLGVESYQKKLNLTKPDTYRSDLKQKEAYTAYSNPRGFIYQNKAKKNKLMRIDELYKFSDGTLNDVQTALNDRLKEIRMKYLP
ncbi:hypothetical protein Tco_1467742 [Tanacetum coccineum]